MPFFRVRVSLVLVCLATLSACGSGDGEPAEATGNTELNAIIRSLGPLPVLSVEYTVNCVSDQDTGVPNEVRLDGELEPANDSAAKIGMLDTLSETWTGFVDLPPGSCLIQLRGRDADGEVICTAAVSFSVVADTAIQVVVPLACRSSGYPPVREMDFNVCPDLLALSCDELDPLEASTSCEVRFGDSDDTCGPSCDPQTCTVSPEGLSCAPGPDPGVSTTITCTDGLLDCTGDGLPDPSCFIDRNPSNALPEFVEASFSVACVPREPDSTLGMTITCTAVTSDGDIDCDKRQVIRLDCPDPGP